MLEGVYGRVVLPVGKYSREANIPGTHVPEPVELSQGGTGVKVWQ